MDAGRFQATRGSVATATHSLRLKVQSGSLSPGMPKSRVTCWPGHGLEALEHCNQASAKPSGGLKAAKSSA